MTKAEKNKARYIEMNSLDRPLTDKEETELRFLEKRLEDAERIAQFKKNQAEPYASKRSRAVNLAWEFYRNIDIDGQCYVAVGGLDTIIPAIYGKIVTDEKGMLQTTDAQRTGCSMCGFGIHMESRPHRFDLLWERNPKEWEFWMNRVAQDKDGNWYGWGRVLDYIGVRWTHPEVWIGAKRDAESVEQLSFEDF